MNSVGAAQQKPAAPPTRLSVVQEAPGVADIVLWQRGEIAAWCRSQPSQPPVRTNGQTERNQIINKDGIARRVLATGTALSNETSPEELCERMAAFSPVRPDLTSLLAERKKPFTVIAVNMDEKNKNTNYRSIYKQRPDYMTLD